jgi:aspartate/methionine/tyrosine aminotransferase
MRLEPFKLERIMSEWQNEVELDLSMSGVDAACLSDFISPEEMESVWANTKLRFVQTNGPEPLRDAILRKYPGAGRDNVLVTNGSSEALMVLLWKICEPGTEIVEISPTYSLIGGLAKTFGAVVKQVGLIEEAGWKLDIEALGRAVTESTAILYVGNPNNPTGSILSESEMQAIVDVAERAQTLLVADEIYQGAELSGAQSSSFWGRYDRTIVTSSVSKAHGLAGMRLGWMVGPKELVNEVWHYHDYTTTTTTALSSQFVTMALEPAREQKLLDRALAISRSNFKLLDAWMKANRDIVSGEPTKVGGFAFVKVDTDLDSETLAFRLAKEHGVLVGPGNYFGAEKYMRLGYSIPHLEAGLNRLSTGLRSINGAA